MFSENFFDLVLNFGDDWKVTKVELNTKKMEVDVYVEYQPYDKTIVKIYDSAPLRRWRHLDTMQYKTYINCRLPRIKDEFGKVTTLKAPWADTYQRHTYLFERLAIDILQATKNQTKTAEILRCGFNVINKIIHSSVNRGLALRPKNFAYKHLSIDEKSFKKGHKYVTVLSSPIAGLVIDVSEDRNTKSCEELITNTISKENLAKVETVSMDMWKPYMNTVKSILPDSKIVHDRFHLVQYLNKAIDAVRRREVKQHELLKNSRYAFLKNPENLTEKQRIKFEEISNANYEISRAWRIKENFRAIFGCSSLIEASGLIIKWLTFVSNTNIKEMTKVSEIFKNHLSGVINAMIESFSNAMAERLNGKIQEVKSTGRGYRKFENFRSAILFFHGGLSLYPLNSQ